MLKSTTCIGLLLIISPFSHGQSKLFPPGSITFDETGKLVKQPKFGYRNGQTVNYVVEKTVTSSYSKMSSQYVNANNEFQLLLNGTTAKENEVYRALIPYYHFFKGLASQPESIKIMVDLFNEALCKVKGLADSLDKTKPIDIDAFVCPCLRDDTGCLRRYVEEQLVAANKLIDNIVDFRQRQELWRQLLCDFYDEKQKQYIVYKLDSVRGMYPVYKLSRPQLLPQNIFPPVVATGPQFFLEDAPLTYRNDTSVFIKTKVSRKPVNLKAKIPYLDEALMCSNRTASLLSRDYAEGLQKNCDDVLQSLSGIELLSYCKVDCQPELLTCVENDLKVLDSVWCFSSPVGKYLRSWVWYSNGALSLNYLDTIKRSTDDKKTEKLTTELAKIDEKIAKLDSLKSCRSCDVRSFWSFADLQHIEVGIVERKKQIEKDLAVLTASRNAFAKMQVTSAILHNISLPIKRNRHPVYTYQIDAQDGYEIKGKRDLFPENHDIFFQVYNSQEPSSAITISEIQGNFNDSGPLQRELTPALTSLAEAYGALSGYGPKIEALAGLIGRPGIKSHDLEKYVPAGITDSAQRAALLKKAKDSIDVVQENCYQRTQNILQKVWRVTMLDTLLKRYLSRIPVNELKGKQAADTSFFTFYQKATAKTAPYSDSFAIYRKSVKLNAGYFNVGRQRTIQIGVGLFYDNKTPKQVTIDTSNNTFNIKSSDNEIKYVIGLKIFPFKNFDADGNIIPRYPVSRLSFFGGFEITDPLKNLYLGIGYDIIPGLQFTCGIHYALRNYYTVQNNQVLEHAATYKTYYPYYGITIDPSVVVGVLKSIFPTK